MSSAQSARSLARGGEIILPLAASPHKLFPHLSYVSQTAVFKVAIPRKDDIDKIKYNAASAPRLIVLL